jgi:hypothetical protein
VTDDLVSGCGFQGDEVGFLGHWPLFSDT